VVYHQDMCIRMGLETMPTRTNRDGGVMPSHSTLGGIVGGRVAIQPKWYSHTVGVTAVRDLYGTC
jgi:restriction system protein